MMNETVILRKPVEHWPGNAEGEIVLAFVPENKYTPFVTWFYNAERDFFCQGHYHQELAPALRDWEKRK